MTLRDFVMPFVWTLIPLGILNALLWAGLYLYDRRRRKR